MVLRMARPQTVPTRRYPIARKVVPAEVRALLGRTEFKRSLRGATPADNRRLHLELMARWEAQIAAAREQLAGRTVRLAPRRVGELAAAWYREESAFWEDEQTGGGDWELMAEQLADQGGPGRQEREAALTLTRDRGIAADADSIERLAVAVLDQRFALCRLMERRATGDWGRDDHLDRLAEPLTAGPPLAGAGKPALTFAALVDRWAAEAQPPQKSLEKWKATWAGVAAAIGHDDARRLSVADVRTWKEARLGAGRSLKTVADGVAVCRAVLNWGIRNGLLEGPNVFSGMAPKMPKHGLGARDGYTDDEARRVLEAARKESGWLRWLPFVLAYTGARIEEAAEARARDVRREGGVWVLDIVPTATRRLKTGHAQRMIPVHPALEAEGFLAYAAGLPQDGPLFPDLAPGRYGSRGSTATKAHSRWVRSTVGITDPRKAPAHSWRHRLEDQLRIARVPVEAQDAITGHDNPRNAGAGYGKGFRGMPEEVLKELARVPACG